MFIWTIGGTWDVHKKTSILQSLGGSKTGKLLVN